MGQRRALARAVVFIDGVPHAFPHDADMRRLPLGAVRRRGRSNCLRNTLRRRDLPDEAGPPQGAAVGQRSRVQPHLQRRHQQGALADRQVAGVAVAPTVAPDRALPVVIGHQPLLLEVHADAAAASEAAGAGHGLNRLRTAGERRMVEIDIAGIADGRAQIEAAMTPVLPAAEARRAEVEEARAGKARARGDLAAAQRRQQDHRLEGAARGIFAGGGAVVQWPVLVLEQTVPDPRRQHGHKRIGVIARRTRQRQHVAIARINDHSRTALVGQHRLGRLLDAPIHRQLDIAAPTRRAA